MASYNELLKKYRKLAKRADQRLVRLERYSDVNKNVKEWAYKQAMFEIKKYGGEGATRFNIKPPEDQKQLERKIAAIENFLFKPTSQVRNIIKIEKKRLESLKTTLKKDNRFEGDIPFADWIKIHQSGTFERMEEKYGFYTSVKSLGVIEKEQDKIKQIIEDAKEENISLLDMIGRYAKDGKLDMDFALRQTVAEILEDQDLKLEDLL